MEMMMFYIELDQRSDAWFSWREKGITATEAAVSYTHLDVYKRQGYSGALSDATGALWNDESQ